MTFHELTAWDVAIAAALILINVAISIGLKLGLDKRLLWASFRTIVQLTLIGYVLEWIFAIQSWPIMLLLGVVMTTVAAFSAIGRVEHSLPRMRINSLISIFASRPGGDAPGTPAPPRATGSPEPTPGGRGGR